MSYEVFGDGADPADYDHLLEAGWWYGEQVDEIKALFAALYKEPIYEDGKKDNGVSTKFLMRLNLLAAEIGHINYYDPLAVEARAYFGAPDTIADGGKQ